LDVLPSTTWKSKPLTGSEINRIEVSLDVLPSTTWKMPSGQYALYLSVLEVVEPERKLYLAIGKAAYDELSHIKAFGLIVKRFQVALIVVEATTQEIVEWKE
jgi:hypothetical protein